MIQVLIYRTDIAVDDRLSPTVVQVTIKQSKNRPLSARVAAPPQQNGHKSVPGKSYTGISGGQGCYPRSCLSGRADSSSLGDPFFRPAE